MGRPGVIAFPVLLALGAITGYLTYDWMVIQATPVEGINNSPYRKDLESASQNQPASPAAGGQQPDETPASGSESLVVTISILEGSIVQGAPAYDPDTATVPLDATIRWVNDDSLVHTATYGTGFSQANFGSLFDTGFLNAAGEYRIAASQIGVGEYPYFCLAHPYMTATLVIE